MGQKDKEDDSVDKSRRQFLLTTTSVVGGIGAIYAAIPFLSSMSLSAKVQAAGAPVEVDISQLEPGGKMTVKWQGKPVWIVRRTKEMVAELKDPNYPLRDPNSKVDQQPPYAQNFYRSINPEYLVLIGICTHLGCSPTYRPAPSSVGPDWPGGFFCPCHGSKFDFAGRVFVDVPAPVNLVVPPYKFVDAQTILIGVNEDETKAES